MHANKPPTPSLLFCALVLAPHVAACGADKREPEEKNLGSRDIENVLLIENCEDGDAVLIQDEEAGFIGYWYTYDDRQECVHPDFASEMVVPCGSETCAAAGNMTQTNPAIRPYAVDFTMTSYAEAEVAPPALEGAQESNGFGLRLTGGGNMYFGAGVGVGLNNPGSLQPYDLAAGGYVALRFVAKSGIAGATIPLQVKIKDAYSEPAGGNCKWRKNECKSGTCLCCDDPDDPADQMCTADPIEITQGCHADPRYSPIPDTMVTDQWQLYELPFDDFSRETWGAYKSEEQEPPGPFVPSQAFQLQFQVQTGATPATEPLEPFELWIDNIGFMTVPPAGATPGVTPGAGGGGGAQPAAGGGTGGQ